jgi:hypothetical protein
LIEFTQWGVTVKIWPGEIMGVLLIASVIWFFWKAQRDPKNPIDLAEMLTWPGTRHTSLIFVLSFLSGITGIWIIVDNQFRGKLTTEMYLGFLTIMICGKGMTEFANAYKNKPPNPIPPAPQQQFVSQADTVTQPAAATPPITPPVMPKKRKR